MTKFGVKYIVTLTDTTKNNMEDDVEGFVKGKGLISLILKKFFILLLDSVDLCCQ